MFIPLQLPHETPRKQRRYLLLFQNVLCYYNVFMKRIEERPPQTTIIVYRVLLGIIAVLVLILIVGTIYGLVKREKTAPPPAPIDGTDENIFSSLGTLRIPTADSEPETLIISVYFPYDKNDRPFSEELASRISAFKTATSGYLGAFTAEELDVLDTDLIKNELLKRYNAELRLGQIRELYITDFMRL